MQSFIQKQKNFKLRTKNAFKNLGIFELQFNENCDEIFNQHPRIVKTINFPLKWKKKLRTKNAIFGSLGWSVEKQLSYV